MLLRQLLQRPDPVKILQERERRRSELRTRLNWPERDESPEILVIRLRHYKKYPEPDVRLVGFSASAWFKFEVKAVTDNALEVFDSIQEVRISNGVATPVEADGKSRRVFVVGRIPLETIALIDWSADPAFGLPRIYSRFGRRGPFSSEAVLYEKLGPGDFREIYGVRYKGRRIGIWERLKFGWDQRRYARRFRREGDAGQA